MRKFEISTLTADVFVCILCTKQAMINGLFMPNDDSIFVSTDLSNNKYKYVHLNKDTLELQYLYPKDVTNNPIMERQYPVCKLCVEDVKKKGHQDFLQKLVLSMGWNFLSIFMTFRMLK